MINREGGIMSQLVKRGFRPNRAISLRASMLEINRSKQPIFHNSALGHRIPMPTPKRHMFDDQQHTTVTGFVAFEPIKGIYRLQFSRRAL